MRPIYLFLFLLLIGVACSESPVTTEQPFFEVQPDLDTVTFAQYGGEQKLEITTNQEVQLSTVPAWLQARFNSHTKLLTLETQPNENDQVINTELTLSAGMFSKKLTILQWGKQSGLDKLGNVAKVPIKYGSTSSFQSGEDIERSFDGNMQTLYHSAYANEGENYFPITLEYFFEQQEQIDYLIYYPRTIGTNGAFKEVEIFSKSSGSNVYHSHGVKDFKGKTSPTILTFDTPLKNPTAIKFQVRSGAGNFASCAEMEFYRKNKVETDIFTDKSCSELKPGVTEEQINSMNTPYLQNLAMEIFKGRYSTGFRVGEFFPYPYPDQKETLKTFNFSILDNPTGIMVESGEELVVMVNETYGQDLSLRVIDLTKDFSGDNYMLTDGINKIKFSNGGLVYVMYHTTTETRPIKIHFVHARQNGYFDINKHMKEEWRDILYNAKDKHIDVLGKYVHFCFPVADFKKSCSTDVTETLRFYDELVSLEWDFIGLNKYNRQQKNRMCFVADYESSTHMYASDYRTAYTPKTIAQLLDPGKMKNNIWGPAHEVGHCLQTGRGMKWIGMTEVTNNIKSLYAQTKLTNGNRNLNSIDGYRNIYEKAFKTMLKNSHPFCFTEGITEHVFVQLLAFWQLQLFVAELHGNKYFYADIYEQVRNDEMTRVPSDGEAQLNFVYMACKYSGYDLIPFFEKWGFLQPISVAINDYSTRTLTITDEMIRQLKERVDAIGQLKPIPAVYYLTDENIELFKNPAAVVPGSATLNENILMLSNWQNVVAYEVYKNNELLDIHLPLDSIPLDDKESSVYAVGADGGKEEVVF